MVDVHCHLNFKAFANDYDQVIKDAFSTGVKKIINVGTKIDSSQKAVELAEKYDHLFAIVGVHPHHADKVFSSRHPELGSGSNGIPNPASPASTRGVQRGEQVRNDKLWLEELESLTKHPKVVAIGEIGLDNYRYQSNGIADPEAQKEIFIKQIELAHQLKLPLQIHNRHAGKEIFDILLSHKSYLLNLPGMFHCFSGNIEFLKRILELGFYVGFDGNITYKGLVPGEDTSLPKLVEYAPLDRIVTETDSPYLTPEPHRGNRNKPSYVILVAKEIAKIKGVSFEKVIEQTEINAVNLFKLKS